MAVDFAKQREDAEKAGLLSSGDYFKVKEGPNRIRLMSVCPPHANEYKGERRFQWLCYVLDRREGKSRAYFMPHAIYKQIEALQGSDDYAFTDVPMPYDLTINVTNAGTKEAKYTVIPAKKETPLTTAELSQLGDLKPLVDLQKALKAKNGAAPQDEHGPLGDDDVPPFMRD